ncbi:hypothetical protein K488DRAFT_58969, partial [Vararia minispora EC-137]
STGSFPRPIPAHECSVCPLTLTDAIPVDAVIASRSEGSSFHSLIISRSKTDFPVPESELRIRC